MVGTGKKLGRPSSYSAARIAPILTALRGGSSWSAAIGLAGVRANVAARWREEHPEFESAILRAEAEAERDMSDVLRVAAFGMEGRPGDWRAAESWLKRRRRKDWGDEISLRSLSDEDILRLLVEEGRTSGVDGLLEGEVEVMDSVEAEFVTDRDKGESEGEEDGRSAAGIGREGTYGASDVVTCGDVCGDEDVVDG